MNATTKKIAILLLVLALCAPGVMPRAEAMDPVTIAILAPLAVKAAQVAAPYVVRGIKCGALQMKKMGIDLAKIIALPLGLCQMTVGAPFGYFKRGANNCWIGIQSPFKLVWDTLMLPLAFAGVKPPG